MRCVLLIVGVAVLAGCPPQTIEKLPPVGQFYFPTGIVHQRASAAGEGILYVASADFDKRYDFGAITTVDLDKVGLPKFNDQDAGLGQPLQLIDLKLTNASVSLIAPFAGEMAALKIDGGVRLYLPTRSERHRLYGLDARLPVAGAAPKTDCFVPFAGLAGTTSQDGGMVDCTPTGMTLVGFEKTETSIPRAPAPIGVAVSPSRQVWVTSLQQADTPKGSTLDARGYIVHVDGDNPSVGETSFVNIGAGGSNSIAVSQNFAYATGRIYTSGVPASLVRAVNTNDFLAYNTFLENSFTAFEGRGVALSSNTVNQRLYMLGRAPDTLIVASVTENALSPNVRVERSVPLPEAPNLITTIPRPGKSDLVMITCSTAGVVVFYDDDVGSLTGQIPGVGLQPYAIAVDTRLNGARVYVTNFTDGRVAVIDVPDLNRPSSARIVAFLGSSQLCITRGVNEQTSCDGGSK